MQVSPQTSQPLARARAIGSTASSQVTWTMYTGQPARCAISIARFVASPSSAAGRVFACQLGSRWPAATASFTSRSITSPFSPWIIASAPVSLASRITL